jgi:monofunctional glycosyltransferase
MVRRLFMALPLALVGAAWFYWVTIPWGLTLRIRDPQTTAVMRQRVAEARAQGQELEIRHQWVPLEQISPRLRRAVIAAEDGRFYQHNGIDWNALREEFRYRGDDSFSILDGDDRRALRESFRYYRQNRDRIRGRSTITQQVAKNLYFSTQRSTLRKLEEFVVARRMERVLEKDRILEIYLNVAELGPGIFGAEAAARHYFNRSAAELTMDQAAALAATLPHPRSSNPGHNPGRMQWRKNMILARMGGSGPVETVPLETATQRVPEDEPAPIGVPAGGYQPRDSLPVIEPPRDTLPTVPDTVPPLRQPPDTLPAAAGAGHAPAPSPHP